MTNIMAPMCLSCQRFNSDDSKFSCTAYPDGIPQEIIASKIDHRKPYEGDNDLQFLQNLSKPPFKFDRRTYTDAVTSTSV